MTTPQYHITNANQAVAQIAYKTNEVIPIYPITPASEMSELSEQWSAQGKQNVFGQVPTTFEMQSEAGVAGTMHGALQTGALSTTFTASQGLLLMLPNMYKISGELTPNVIHVATRSIATHALSVFGDHSDIMAVRQSGYAFLGSASVQEAQDFALIAQAASLASRIPFVHFFDGFRTSHEISKIEVISDNIIKQMIDESYVEAHRNRALNPNQPVLRGTSQGPDTYFQSREAVNSFYKACPDIVQNTMQQFEQLTGRSYQLFDYVGHSKAKHIIISMASSTSTVEDTINYLNSQGEQLGLIKVRLFRPFSTKHLINALPPTCTSIAVLDRTKEPGSTGEPLYLDVVQSLCQAFQNKHINHLPNIIGGRYGLSSKEFTPPMVKAIFDNLKQRQPKHNFTVGIHDDVTHLSLATSKHLSLTHANYEAIFYQEKCNTASQYFKNTLNYLGNQKDIFVQGYTECDYKKSNSRSISHLRIANQPIYSSYLIQQADFIACQDVSFIDRDDVLDIIKPKGMLLINSSLTSKLFWQALSANHKYQIIEKEIEVYIVNLNVLNVLYPEKISGLYACFLALKQETKYNALLTYISEVETVIDNYDIKPIKQYNDTFINQLLALRGNDIPVSQFPVDGSYPTNTSIYNPPVIKKELPKWDMDLCTQCGACSMACPQAALRINVFDEQQVKNIPSTFPYIDSNDFDLMQYTLQINPEQCNACNHCIDACEINALSMVDTETMLPQQKKHWSYFEQFPEFDRSQINPFKISEQQLQEPLFKYSIGVEGCGEAPYLKLLSQLFGERLLVANATGASSIFGGALPTTPWATNKNGKGPAWSNSLFEDNAEFGLGFQLSLEQQKQQALSLLKDMLPQLEFDEVYDIINAKQYTEKDICLQQQRIDALKSQLQHLNSSKARQLLGIIDHLVKKSVWVVGGDGWAYDIGYGGLDHALASGENINILVLDNEVYDNTGGQTSKATPFGAEAKFSFGGKRKQKKDLGKIAMQYDNVYVASVAIGADQEQTLKAFIEAEQHDGPSIIIAYCHSESHGIDMKHPRQYHKAAVTSGQWLLYRRHPKNIGLQLDSEAPSIPIEDYLKLEQRFAKLFKTNPEELNLTIHQLQQRVDKRYEEYRQLTTHKKLQTY